MIPQRRKPTPLNKTGKKKKYIHKSRFLSFRLPTEPSAALTIAEDGEPQEGQVALALYWVPAQIWVTFGYEHGAALEATASQVRHYLNIRTQTQSLNITVQNKLVGRQKNIGCSMEK